MIVAPPQYIIELRFASFDLEQDYECEYDYVAIYDGVVTNETNRTAIGKYCGSEKPPTLLSSTNQLTLFFKSDTSVNGQGFLVQYDFIDGRNCNWIFLFKFLKKTHKLLMLC